jgi:hypothetical protein
MDRGSSCSAELHSCVFDEVLGLVDDELLLALRLHDRADHGADRFEHLRLFGLFKPGLHLGGVALFLLLILHFAQEELPLQLLPRDLLYEVHESGFGPHESLQLRVDLGVDFELLGEFLFLFR